MYTFILKVSDEADQSDTTTVHVFVKPPTNKPPTGNDVYTVIIEYD